MLMLTFVICYLFINVYAIPEFLISPFESAVSGA